MPPKSAIKKITSVIESDDDVPSSAQKIPKSKATQVIEESDNDTPPRVRKSGVKKRLHPRSPSPFPNANSEDGNPFIDAEASEDVEDKDAEHSDNSLADFIVDDDVVESSEIRRSSNKKKAVSRSISQQEAIDTEEDIEATESVVPTKTKKTKIIDSDDEVDDIKTSSVTSPTKTVKISVKAKATEIVESDDEVEFVKTPTAKSPTKATKGSAKNTKIAKNETPVKTAKNTPKGSARSKGKGKKAISPEFISDSEQEPLEDLPLQKDDSMYKGPPASQRVISKKRPIPVTPPLQTRAAIVNDGPKEDSPKESPTKKQRVKAEKIDDTPRSKLPATSTKAGPFNKSVKSALKSEDSDYDDTMATTLKDTKEESLVKPVFLEDLTTLTIKSLPEECEVDDPHLYDPLLVEYDGYQNLYALRVCEIKTANGRGGNRKSSGQFKFSAWPQVIPKLKLPAAIGVITFVQDDYVVNPSRISPLLLTGRLLQYNRYELSIGTHTALCITPILVAESFLQSDPAGLASPFHCIRGVFHSFEWERYCGALGMLCGQTEMGGQVWNNTVSFQTKTMTNAQASGAGPAPSSALPSSFFNQYESPTKAKLNKSKSKKAFAPLDYSDAIRVYDGRRVSKDVKWSASIFNNLGEYFPPWGEPEIPKHSFVVVGYIVHIVSGTGGQEWKTYNYIQWALVLGAPA